LGISADKNDSQERTMANTSRQLAFVTDDETMQLIEDLKRELGAATNAALIRKTLALAKLAAEQSRDSGGIVVMRGHGQDAGSEIRVATRA
jgi:hypothetical protein